MRQNIKDKDLKFKDIRDIGEQPKLSPNPHLDLEKLEKEAIAYHK
jgi:hypothetical protein